MRKSLYLTISILIFTLSFAACNTVEVNENVTIKLRNGYFLCEADITHDGTTDEIKVDYQKMLKDSQSLAKITVSNDSGVIWQDEVGIPHSSWGGYYLISEENDTYLMFYLPEESQGQIAYMFQLFYLDENGVMQIVDEAQVNSWESDDWEKKLTEFEQKVSLYLDKGELLISTNNCETQIYGLE